MECFLILGSMANLQEAFKLNKWKLSGGEISGMLGNFWHFSPPSAQRRARFSDLSALSAPSNCKKIQIFCHRQDNSCSIQHPHGFGWSRGFLLKWQIMPGKQYWTGRFLSINILTVSFMQFLRVQVCKSWKAREMNFPVLALRAKLNVIWKTMSMVSVCFYFYERYLGEGDCKFD